MTRSERERLELLERLVREQGELIAAMAARLGVKAPESEDERLRKLGRVNAKGRQLTDDGYTPPEWSGR